MQYPKQEDNYDVDIFNYLFQQLGDKILGLTNRLNALADSDDTTLDQLSEIVAYIKSNRSLIENITTGKINVSDIVDNLTSTATNKPLSAKQGKALKDLIDALTTTVGTKVDKVSGKGLSTNDYTTLEKNKLTAIGQSVQNISTLKEFVEMAITSGLNTATGKFKTSTTADELVQKIPIIRKDYWYQFIATWQNDYNQGNYDIGLSMFLMSSSFPELYWLRIDGKQGEYRLTQCIDLNKINSDTIIVNQTGTSLDSYVETGIYYFSTSYTPTDIPIGVNGWLLVFKGTNAIKQLWFRHGTANTNDYNTFVRTKTGASWSNWTRIVTEKDISIPVILTGTLAANATSISFTNAAITSTATIDVYTDVFGVNPTNMTISGTKLTLTFAARSAATGVKVKISQS